MQALVRRLLFSAGCAWLAIGCFGVESGGSYGAVYYDADWYYGDVGIPRVTTTFPYRIGLRGLTAR
jgi:hypothetical protein